MSYWHKKCIAAIVIIATLWLPLFSDATVGETIASTGISLGAQIDKNISFTLSLPHRAATTLAHTIETSAHALRSLGEAGVDSMRQVATALNSNLQRQHSMLSLSAKTLMAKAESNLREQIAGIHRMLGAKTETKTLVLRNLENAVGTTRNVVKHLVSDTLSALSPAPSSDVEEESVRSADDGNTSNVEREVRTVHPAATRYVENNEGQTVKIIERIIVKEPRATSELANSNSSLLASGYTLNPYQDPRINTLITNVADLTTRIDEQRGNLPANLAGAYSNSALFNMIASFQRIKTLDDVKITNATIEGYVRGVTLENYLQLAGGTLTGSLIGTTISLSSTLNASSTAHITGLTTLGNNLTFSASSATTTIPAALRNAFALATSSAPTPFLSFDTNNYRIGIGSSSPAQTFSLHGSHYLTGGLGVGNATTTAGVLETSGLTYFGGLLKGASDFTFAGTGTSTITGRLAVTASSSMAGYRLCSQFNDICSPFTDTGSNVTLRISTNFLGLGTSTPAEKLSINGGVLFDSDIIRISSSSAASLTIKYFSRATTTIPDLIKNSFSFATSTSVTPFVSFDTLNYRVGIGTTSPIATFSLKGSQFIAGGLGVGNATTTSGILETSGLSYIGGILKGASTFTFAGTGSSFLQGALGIATTSPAQRFSLNGPAFFDSPYLRYGSSTAPNLNFRYFASSTSTIPNLTSAFTFATSTTNTPLLTLSTKSSRYGRVGIGTSSPSALFAINALNSSNQADNLFYIGSSTQNTFVIDNHGNIGIGTSTRSTSKARLAITGFGTGTNRILALADANNVERFTVQEDGNVGIGTTGPETKLHVASGNILLSNNQAIQFEDTDGTNRTLVSMNSSNMQLFGTTNNNLTLQGFDLTINATRTAGGGTDGAIDIKSTVDLGATDELVQIGDSASDFLTILGNGNVGIGTTTPAERLSINGRVLFDSDIIRYGSSSQPTLNFRYFASSTSTIPNLTSAFTFATSTTNTPLLTLSTKSSRYGRVGIGTSSPSALFAINALNSSNQADNIFYIGSSTANILTVDNHGNVGIGTTGPDDKFTIDTGLGSNSSLTVGATTSPSGLVLSHYITTSGAGGGNRKALAQIASLAGSTGQSNYQGILTFLTTPSAGSPTERMRIDASGNVGIGTTGPLYPLQVKGSTLLTTDDFASGVGSTLFFERGAATGDTYFVIRTTITGQNANGNLVLQPNGGNVGIGTTSPGLLLGVAGDILLQMNQPETTNGVCHSGADIDAASSDGRALVVCSAAPGDIAEWYEAQSDVEEGDIVSLSQNLFSYTFSPSNPFTGVIDKATIITEEAPIIKKAEETNSLLLGVVSASPYQTFGNAIRDQGTHPKPVALIGRAQVKVSQENGPIAIGDRIAVSSEAGIGRKANPDEQTIGIALNPYEGEGIGMILVFINLGHTKLDPSISSGQVTTENSGMWWINQTTGELTSNGMPLNIQGATINNVNAIYSASGNWRIDGEGRLVVQSVKTQKLEVGSSGQPEGVTLYDKLTGEAYCAAIAGGEWQKIKGICSQKISEITEAASSTDY